MVLKVTLILVVLFSLKVFAMDAKASTTNLENFSKKQITSIIKTIKSK